VCVSSVFLIQITFDAWRWLHPPRSQIVVSPQVGIGPVCMVAVYRNPPEMDGKKSLSLNGPF
jgi:hypothetical protein